MQIIPGKEKFPLQQSGVFGGEHGVSFQTVSYTHLDVYKRQIQYRTRKMEVERCKPAFLAEDEEVKEEA